jgi:EAL domain-containing protein (putative c-di-GMP-specific phosphodiesterase class I)
MATVAEGVETDERMARVASDGCTDVQVYLFSRSCRQNKSTKREKHARKGISGDALRLAARRVMSPPPPRLQGKPMRCPPLDTASNRTRANALFAVAGLEPAGRGL